METEFDEIDRGPEESEVAVLEGHLTSLEKRGEIPSLQFQAFQANHQACKLMFSLRLIKGEQTIVVGKLVGLTYIWFVPTDCSGSGKF